CASLPALGSSAVAVSASMAGLSPNTSYHFRVVASNVGGTASGPDLAFTTLPSPPSVKTAPAYPPTQTPSTLNATVNPNGGAVSNCHFEYGSSSAYGTSLPCAALPGSGTSAVAVSAQLQGLTANSTYHFRIVATNAGGTSAGADQTLSTLPNPPSVKTAAASARTQTAATLNATANPNGGAVSDCHFEYGTTAAYDTSVPSAALPGA